ncbi:MAG: 30S ribosomal protein S21 [Candidatus Nealsonbacteria bacterium]|nr:30S ribosomal protein S21 [Candidatus Nealsonbacteria bacterium]
MQVKKQEREPTQVLIRRFQKSMQQSGILVRARKGRFHARKKSEAAKKKAAMRREELRQEYAELKKMGKA